MNQKIETLVDRYVRICSEPSNNINEHLPVLESLARQCRYITEMGVGGTSSTTALLHASPEVMVSYDCNPSCGNLTANLQALLVGTDFRFICASTLEIEIEPTDMLFIDTYHTFTQLAAELKKHHDKVRKWLVLHDTTSYGVTGEDGLAPGLWAAVEQFLAATAVWSLKERLINQNGLTILERQTG